MATNSDIPSSKNDNFPTPIEAWRDIEEYIPKDKKIWCPFYFNGEHTLKTLGYDIIHQNEDFFECNHGDIIIDNPPFSIKKKVVERMLKLDKPFILIMPVSTLCYQYMRIFKGQIQIIIPPKRIQFDKNSKSGAYFDCLYFCYKMDLPRDIIWLE